MKSAVKNSVLSALLLALLTTTACRREPRNENTATPPPAVPAAPSTASTSDHAEVFRRAFWRQPTPADRILNAERRIDPTDASWSWFIQLHPGPELLAALRDPETFGLLPLGTPTSPSAPFPASPPPAWFPNLAAPATRASYEILRTPASALTLFYRSADNVLFATDHGTAFAPPAQ